MQRIDGVIAIGYCRRSKESGARTVSLEEQAGRIRAYCAAQGWTLAELVTDDGVSGGRRERLVRLQETVKRRQARVVIVYHLDRFARDVAGMLDSLRAFSKRGVELHVVGRGRVEAETASGFLMTGVEGLMAEHYRRLVGEKTRDALAGLRAKGRRVSRFAPYGYRFADDGLTLERQPVEQAALVLMRQLAPGRSLRALSAALAERGVMARNGRPFAANVLRSLVLNRPVTNSETPEASAVTCQVGSSTVRPRCDGREG
jgi:DNA invertase Pin-like site-specific DNA recombinase